MVPVPPFLGPGFWLGARWNRLGEAVKTRKKREKTGKKWARYGLKRVNTGRDRRDQLDNDPMSVYVSNINWDTDRETLGQKFAEFGKVINVSLKEN